MKILSILFMIAAAVGLILSVVMGLVDRVFPLGSVPASALLEFAKVCILFSIATSLYHKASKS